MARLARRCRLAAERVLVLHDDLDLAPGRVRVKLGGSSGGHRGVASCEEWLRAPFWRLRVGIGRPASRADVASFVLEPFSAAELAEIPLGAIAEHLPLLLGAGGGSLPPDGAGGISHATCSAFLNALASARTT